jgi:hypothetical protein
MALLFDGLGDGRVDFNDDCVGAEVNQFLCGSRSDPRRSCQPQAAACQPLPATICAAQGSPSSGGCDGSKKWVSQAGAQCARISGMLYRGWPGATVHSTWRAGAPPWGGRRTENIANADFLRTTWGENGPPFSRCRVPLVAVLASAGTPRASRGLYGVLSRHPTSLIRVAKVGAGGKGHTLENCVRAGDLH